MHGDKSVKWKMKDTQESGIFRIKIERASNLFCRHAFDDVRIDHRCPNIAMPQEALDRSDVVVSLHKKAPAYPAFKSFS